MRDRLDPLEANAPPRRPRPSLWCALAGLVVFGTGSVLAYVLFTLLWLLAEPTHNSLVAILAFFALFAGTGISSGLGLFVYHRLGRKAEVRRLTRDLGGVFVEDRRSGSGPLS